MTPLSECPTLDALQQCDTPDKAAEYWKLHVATHPHFNPECECLAVLLLNVRRRIKGHQLVSIGTQDTVLVHPREVFRLNEELTTAALRAWAAMDLPARLLAAQVAKLLNCSTEDVGILVSAGKLRPLGKPNTNAVKFFNSIELIALLADPDWLDDATKTIGQFWKRKNARRQPCQFQ